MKYIFATHNNNKINEIKPLIDKNIKIVTLKDLNYQDEIIEDGLTFKENALIKAKTIYDIYKIPVIADDSGLMIKSLNNEPGVNSKRYSDKGDLGNNLKVLKKLKNINNRNAQFVTIICLYDGNKATYFEGVLKGTIAYDMKGKAGFGYDPLFIPIGYDKTISELGMEVKQKISHRSIAINKLIKYLIRE